ncbi:MAG: hypothetical protein QME57_04585 [Patescibacteria group bacterium]|nr:hypothetical protein [Patescibacteria group bacterium]
MSKKPIYLLLIIILGLSLIGWLSYLELSQEMKESVQAATTGNVSGWAWFGSDCIDEITCSATTSPIGWISFNSNNPEITCKNISYGVNVDYKTGEISGSAFIGIGENNNITDCNNTENTVGWLYFDYTGIDWPENVTPPYDFPAKLVRDEIRGWAPIISKDSMGNQTIVTWVRFKGENYSVKINSDDGTVGTSPLNLNSDHYAWTGKGSEGGLGWIDFAAGRKPVKFPPFNQQPYVESGSAQITEKYCNISPGTGLISFQWTYKDYEKDSQSHYWLQVATDSNFNNKVIDCSDISQTVSDGNHGSAAVKVVSSPVTDCNLGRFEIGYNNSYYWRVAVKAATGNQNWSEWEQGTRFKTPLHAYPYPDFTHSPEVLSIGQVVTFIDNSICYSSDNVEYKCKDGGDSIQYAWDFDYIEREGFTIDSTQKGDATTTYSEVRDYEVQLKITDNSLSPAGVCIGEGSSPVRTTFPVPEYREVPPIIRLKNFLAWAAKFFVIF